MTSRLTSWGHYGPCWRKCPKDSLQLAQGRVPGIGESTCGYFVLTAVPGILAHLHLGAFMEEH
eukprot:6183508-Pleurochrysis_carterae.AAC.1